MSRDERSLERLFAEMSREGDARAPAKPEAGERARVVGKMRLLHADLVSARGRRVLGGRTGLLFVAAAVVMAGTAFAASGGAGSVKRWLWPDSAGMRLVAAPTSRATEHAPLGPVSASRAAPVEAPPARALEPASTAEPGAPDKRAVPQPSARDGAARALELQNQMFADAKRARREHNDVEALALCNELLLKYPGSVLAQEASVERFRALSRLGRSDEARRFADAYLLRYPRGFAADEARALTAGAEAK